MKNQTAILEQQLKQAEARQKLITTVLPSSDVKPLEGTVKIDGDHPVESQILAYHALNRLAKKITEVVTGVKPKRILIHSEADINSLMSFQSFFEQMLLIRDELTSVNKGAKSALEEAVQTLSGEARSEMVAVPFALAPVIAGAVLRSAIDLLSLFRVDVSLKSKDLTINDLALVATVSGRLVGSGVPVFNPSLIPPHLFAKESRVRENLRELDKLSSDLDETRRDLEQFQEKVKAAVTELSDKLTAAAVPPPDTKPLKQAIDIRQRVFDRLAISTARLNATTTAFNTFRETLLKTDEASGLNALARLLRSEKLSGAAGEDSHLLVLKVAAAGGGLKTKQSKFSSGKVMYSGGAIVEYLLFAPDGSTAAAGTLPAYTGFIEVNEREEEARDLQPFAQS